ncbi:hypothetical protein WwAna0487, partial [Wolbachia endosymbiont of Drosophila ananassae]
MNCVKTLLRNIILDIVKMLRIYTSISENLFS